MLEEIAQQIAEKIKQRSGIKAVIGTRENSKSPTIEQSFGLAPLAIVTVVGISLEPYDSKQLIAELCRNSNPFLRVVANIGIQVYGSTMKETESAAKCICSAAEDGLDITIEDVQGKTGLAHTYFLMEKDECMKRDDHLYSQLVIPTRSTQDFVVPIYFPDSEKPVTFSNPYQYNELSCIYNVLNSLLLDEDNPAAKAEIERRIRPINDLLDSLAP